MATQTIELVVLDNHSIQRPATARQYSITRALTPRYPLSIYNANVRIDDNSVWRVLGKALEAIPYLASLHVDVHVSFKFLRMITARYPDLRKVILHTPVRYDRRGVAAVLALPMLRDLELKQSAGSFDDLESGSDALASAFESCSRHSVAPNRTPHLRSLSITVHALTSELVGAIATSFGRSLRSFSVTSNVSRGALGFIERIAADIEDGDHHDNDNADADSDSTNSDADENGNNGARANVGRRSRRRSVTHSGLLEAVLTRMPHLTELTLPAVEIICAKNIIASAFETLQRPARRYFGMEPSLTSPPRITQLSLSSTEFENGIPMFGQRVSRGLCNFLEHDTLGFQLAQVTVPTTFEWTTLDLLTTMLLCCPNIASFALGNLHHIPVSHITPQLFAGCPKLSRLVLDHLKDIPPLLKDPEGLKSCPFAPTLRLLSINKCGNAAPFGGQSAPDWDMSSVFENIMQSCPGLDKLYMTNCGADENLAKKVHDGIKNGTRTPHSRNFHLDLSYNGKITDSTVEQLQECIPHLVRLTLDGTGVSQYIRNKFAPVESNPPILAFY
ncbi:hypothetical protein GQ42DRAFT_180154 [Ramicandelaber brevisporus]|nr:hypothetical protein GQ42DRAFT_180154 [Ramicandelaber brevisporus]